MGMYDKITVPPETACIECGYPISGFQSKDGPCLLKTLDYTQVDQFYSSCDNCGHWNEYIRKEPLPRVPFSDFEIVPKRKRV